MDVALITNGSHLTENKMKSILENCTWVRVSLDAITPATFEKMHGMGTKAFECVIENTKRLAQVKRELGSACTIGVGFLTCDTTKDEMVEAARTCQQWGVDYLQFRPLQVRVGEAKYHWADVDQQIVEACEFSTNGYDVLNSRHKYNAIKTKNYGRDYGKCYGQQFASTIAADGRVYVCCHLRGLEKYCLGDLRQQSFKEIWNSERRREVVKGIDFADCIPLCRDNTFNQVLWHLKQPRSHVNFL